MSTLKRIPKDPSGVYQAHTRVMKYSSYRVLCTLCSTIRYCLRCHLSYIKTFNVIFYLYTFMSSFISSSLSESSSCAIGKTSGMSFKSFNAGICCIISSMF